MPAVERARRLAGPDVATLSDFVRTCQTGASRATDTR